MNVLDFMRGLWSSVASNNPVTMAVDTGANIADLGIAAAGYLGHKTGMLTADQLPDPLDKSRIPGSSAWLDKQAGVNDSTEATVGSLAGMFVNPGKAASTFIGRADKVLGKDIADKRIAQAKKMLDSGVSKEDVWRKTGVTEFGPGNWVTEVSSQGAHLKHPPSHFQVGKQYDLGNVLDHPGLDSIADKELLKRIKGTKVEFYPPEHRAMNGATGGHITSSKKGEPSVIRVAYDEDLEDGVSRALSTLLHEGQHNLTSKTGGWKGGNTAEFTPEIGSAVLAENNRLRRQMALAELIHKNKGDAAKAEEQFAKRFPDSETWSEDEWIQLRLTAQDIADNMDPKTIAEFKAQAQANVNKVMDYKKFAWEKGLGKGRQLDPEEVKYYKQADEAAARAVQARVRLNQREIYENPFWTDGWMDAVTDQNTKALKIDYDDLEFNPRKLGDLSY